MPSPIRSLTMLSLSLSLSLSACQTPAEEEAVNLEETETLPQGLFTRPPMIDHAGDTWLQADEGLTSKDAGWPEARSHRLLTHYTSAGQFKLLMKEDTCSLVLTQLVVDRRGAETTRQLWTSASRFSPWRWGGRPPHRCYAWFQTDGNFVIYGQIGDQPWGEVATYSAIWSSNTWQHPGAQLVLHDNGNLAIYAANGRMVWQTNTAQKPLPVEEQDGTRPSGHPGCRPARTDTRCGAPPKWPLGSLICTDVYVCRSNGPDREESDFPYLCGICGVGKFQ